MSNIIDILNQKVEVSTKFKIGFYLNNTNKKVYCEFNKKQIKKIFVPKFILLKKEGIFIVLKLKDLIFKTHYLVYCKIFKNFFNAGIKILRKRLILKGLGFKMNLSENKKYLIFKVGLSYLVNVEIPKNISIHINKKVLIIEGYNKVSVGNFLYVIRKIKFPESYKEKGFWIKNEKRNLKEIKKT